MANTEIFLRNIFGTTRPNIRPLVLALNITNDLLFEQHISMSDIKATKHIYPDVARLLHKKQKPETVYKSVIRLAHRCWDALVEQDLVLSYLGRSMKQEPDPSVFITYLAVYIQSDINSLSVTLVFFSETRLTYSECLIFRLNRLQSCCCATNRSWFLKQWLLHPRPD